MVVAADDEMRAPGFVVGDSNIGRAGLPEREGRKSGRHADRWRCRLEPCATGERQQAGEEDGGLHQPHARCDTSAYPPGRVLSPLWPTPCIRRRSYMIAFSIPASKRACASPWRLSTFI